MTFQHLEEKRISYCKHLGYAWYYSLLSLKASITFFIHGLYPDWFQTSGSDTVKSLQNTLLSHQQSAKQSAAKQSAETSTS